LVDVDRPILSPVAEEIALSVPLDVEPPNASTALYRLLPDGRVNGPSPPLDVAREADIDRE
jgi:hypothetical protein